jgi:heptose-I-phosphate ethanolaminephosphotransferase
MEPGINIRSLLVASFTFLPLVLHLPSSRSPKIILLVLFAVYVSVAYVVFQYLEKKACRLFRIAASVAIVFSAVNVTYFCLMGHSIGFQVFASIFDTHLDESIEFLSSPFFRRYAIGLLALLALIFGFFRLTGNRIIGEHLLPPNVLWGGVIAIWIVSPIYVTRSIHQPIDFYPFKELDHLVRYVTEVHVLVKDYRNLRHQFTGRIERDKAATVILVIGEAARRDKLGLYGNGVQTTPRLEKFAREHPRRLLIFGDAVAASSYTRISVPSLLSVAPARDYDRITKHPSILKIMKATGHEAILISNQTRRGFHDDLVSAFMEDAAHRNYLTDRGDVHDEALIPPLLRELASSADKSRLIVVHLAGSHFNYKARYPEKEAFFPPTTWENHYLNSLRYTDLVLQRIVDAVVQAGQSMIMLYTSDHGEYLNDYGDGLYDHGNSNHLTRFEIEIPFFIAFNTHFQRSHAPEIARMRDRRGLKISHDNISHTLLGLMGIRDAAYLPSYDLGSPAFVENQRFIVEQSNRITPLEEVHFDQTRFEGKLRE